MAIVVTKLPQTGDVLFGTLAVPQDIQTKIFQTLILDFTTADVQGVDYHIIRINGVPSVVILNTNK